MEEIGSLAEASSRIRNVGMEDHYRRLRYDPAAPVIATPYWPQPSAKLPSSGNGRMKKHPPSMARKKSKDGGSKEGLFDVPNYLKPYRDKYGSVSAHSTSAIYGALRAPHCHAMYNTTDMWYASVRSLNSRPRDVVYPAEAYDWREPVYEDLTREGCPVPTHDVLRRPHCGCMIRRKPPSSARPPPRCKYCATAPPTSGPLNAVPLSSKRSTLHDKSKLNSVSEEKEEKSEHVDRMSGYKKHMSSLSKSKPSRFSRETPSPKSSSMLSRKSILECDVTAYDLMKIPKSPSVSDSDDVDDDLRDNDVVKNKFRLRKHQSKSKSNKSGSKIESLVHRNQKVCSSKVHKLRNENNAYGDTSVFIGGQRIVTNYQSPKPLEPFVHPNHENESFTINGGSSSTRWKKLSVSEEAISIPEPDYDDSEGSEDDQMNTSKFKDLKVTYSPPLIRKSSVDDGLNLSTSREISKSMSSLLSDDTIVPNISINHPYNSSPSIRTNNSKNSSSNEDYQEEEEKSRTERILDSLSADVSDITRVDETEDLINSSSQLYSSKHSKYESFSSSDCSSNGGTLSSDYPTWTSSSSSELKSILKKKKRRENVIQEKESTAKIFCELESKDSQRKKQVQFLANAENSVVVELIQNTTSEVKNNGDNSEQLEAPTSPVIFDSEKIIVSNSKSVIGNDNESIYKILTATNGHDHDGGDLRSTMSSEQHKSSNGSIDDYVPTDVSNKISNKSAADCIPSSQPELSDKIPPNSITKSSAFIDSTSNSNCGLVNKLAGRSSSLEDIREAGKFLHRKKKPTDAAFDDDKRRKRRTTLPKRRFSDLHLHILLCPTKSSLCGDGSSSDDVPLTTSSRRAHRSLPDSPSELEENGSSFCFEFLDKTSKDKEFPSSRSTFYVSVDGASQLENQRITEDISLLKALRNETESSKEVLPSVDGIRNNSISDDEQLDIQETDELTSPLQDDTDEDILENEYENLDPIYEELPDNISNSSKRLTSLEGPQKSFFEGASKTDILSYLEDAKERGLSEGLSEDESKIIPEEDEEEETKIIINDEDEGEKNRLIVNNNINQEVLSEGDEAGTSLENIVTETNGEDTSKVNRSQTAEVERNDSGVGAETSKPSRLNKLLSADSEEQLCADCDHQVEPIEDEMSGILFSPLVCRKCDLRRCERKEIIIEFVDTELKYGRDLRIVKEEFYKPMEIAGLLSKEHLFSVFLNLEELIIFNNKFSEKLQDALDIAMEQGDEDYTTVNIGKIFLETSSMLHAFETYCVKQASASVLLSNMEKEKELLRIFLRVSQMENTLLRRMNLPAFLMVPVQRVTRYPLLLSRLHKVTPIHHKDRNALKEAQQKVELHLEHINQQTKGVGGTKIWRRISNISASHRRLANLQDIGSIKLRKMTLEILKWKQDEVRFVMAGKLLFTQITDYPWNKKGRTVKFAPLHALLVALGKPNSNYRPEVATMDNPILFPRNTGIRDASLVLMKEKNGRFIIVRDPLYLGSCVISNCDSDSDDVFEIQEYTTKEAYLLKGESKKDTKEWLRQLRYHAKDLGSWRRRRNALANIMINGMIRP